MAETPVNQHSPDKRYPYEQEARKFFGPGQGILQHGSGKDICKTRKRQCREKKKEHPFK
jgi:hypothetical protein